MDGYVLGKKLGDGAFGSVYRATKTITDENGTSKRTFFPKWVNLEAFLLSSLARLVLAGFLLNLLKGSGQ